MVCIVGNVNGTRCRDGVKVLWCHFHLVWLFFFRVPSRVFSRDVVLGGNCFCGERKCEEYPKKQTKFVIVWGGNSKLRGEISPLKALKKHWFHPYMRLFSFRKLFCDLFLLFFLSKREERWEGRPRGRCMVYEV